jgi:hypothetical protein
MNNKIISILIVILYFSGFHICDYFYPEGGVDFIKLRISIYCIIILLTIEYKKTNNFIEKLFTAIILNDVIVLLYNNETTYSINDLYFIATFTSIQYIKNLQIIKKWLKQ